MIYSKLYENTQRGTPDFPIEYYSLDSTHPRYLMQAHWHKDYEIIRVKSGTLEVRLNNAEVLLQKNDSVFLPSGIIHSATPKKCKYDCIVISPPVLYATGKCRKLIKTDITKPVIFNNSKTVDSLFKCFLEKQKGYELNTVSMLYSLCADSLNHKSHIKISNEYKVERIKPAITFIEENYATDIKLSDLSQSCTMSSNYFCKFFKEVTSQTPMEYVNIYRIECACDMLNSGVSVTETALNCGFNDLSYFIHVFKKHTGFSPKQYVLFNTKRN